ncbi:MAG TPA: hypothetical protein VFC44_03040 [Candidatus Saccharimonadales bacterium]|nr:hypothetical protein [Candidatus Saccharimonadales bacterium]
MKPHPQIGKVEMIERSMRCFFLGLLGLVPVVGLPMAAMALHNYRRVALGQGALWNPAQRYLVLGGICARLGFTVFFLIPAIICIVRLIMYLS